MDRENDFSGIAIALAWPETYCKQPGSWYDGFMGLLGINNNNYYKAGHAALVLIDKFEKRCFYFDFGRYHAPFQHGRTRGSKTDFELRMHTIPKFKSKEHSLSNLDEILLELQNNEACHGEGNMHAATTDVNFGLAYQKSLAMQQMGAIPYGPFKFRASNCSRFVHTVISAGRPPSKLNRKLKYWMPLTPTPMSNVRALDNYTVIPKQQLSLAFYPENKLEPKHRKATLKQPKLHATIPQGSQWLSGEGCGSWFFLEPTGNGYFVKRYAPSGKLECTGLYKYLGTDLIFDLQDVKITYPSNCREITLYANGKLWRLESFPTLKIVCKAS